MLNVVAPTYSLKAEELLVFLMLPAGEGSWTRMLQQKKAVSTVPVFTKVFNKVSEMIFKMKNILRSLIKSFVI
jgi:hypothetical protein